MNAKISNYSHTKRASSARFHSASHNAIRSSSTDDVLGRFDGSHATTAEDFFSQFWTPGLLDRLQAPLTRYHE